MKLTFLLLEGVKRSYIICPVKGLEMYFSICWVLRRELQPGYLFLSVMKEGKSYFKAPEPQAAQARLNEHTHAEPAQGRLTSDHIPFTVFEAEQ